MEGNFGEEGLADDVFIHRVFRTQQGFALVGIITEQDANRVVVRSDRRRIGEKLILVQMEKYGPNQ